MKDKAREIQNVTHMKFIKPFNNSNSLLALSFKAVEAIDLTNTVLHINNSIQSAIEQEITS
jgi:hypothetical protein